MTYMLLSATLTVGCVAFASVAHAALITLGFNARVEPTPGGTRTLSGSLFSGSFTIDTDAVDQSGFDDTQGLYVLPEVRVHFGDTDYTFVNYETMLQIDQQTTYDDYIVTAHSPTNPVDFYLAVYYLVGTLPNDSSVPDLAILNGSARYDYPASFLRLAFVNGATYLASVGPFFVVPEPSALSLVLAGVGCLALHKGRAMRRARSRPDRGSVTRV